MYGSGGCAQVSRDAPPPLPDGYTVGEKLFYTGTSVTDSMDNTIVHGQQGEVTGPATHESHNGKGVKVGFPGNTYDINCSLTEVRRLPASTAVTLCARAPHTRRCPRPERSHECLSPGAPQPCCKRSSLRHSSRRKSGGG